jgi:hypothetical protein
MDPKQIHSKATNQRQDILNSKNCGCFYCLSIFEPDKITRWTDNSQTALCPNCGVDAVLPDNIGQEINKELLDLMHREYFKI